MMRTDMKFSQNIDAVIDLDKWAEEEGYDSFKHLVRECISGGYGMSYFLKAYNLQKEHQEKYPDIEDESEEAKKAYSKMLDEVDGQMVNFVMEVMGGAFNQE